ncbi:U7 snRNA-associated Sm-like protein LSm11 [Ylistrum balloti]|uniref:U7 snRNA-associated Sm-like protein LSm11 n=1 Tax=Ylistrum balloti TaxID=509963 RepID=UPI002905E396|nr:U7 snRNA-associated Sm-like protein LSm11 [Ylistrum balloti]
MAAPMDEKPSRSKPTKLPPEIDLTSPHFDAAKALFSSHVLLPFSSAKPLDNLAKFESWSKQSSKKEASFSHGNPPSPRKPIRAVPVSRKPQQQPASTELSKHSGRHRNKLNRNVITRMNAYQKGPLNFLRECVEKRHVVKVWTRGACELRGFCTGYLVAFDKYFNLALMDVDETYRKPVSRDNRIQKHTEKVQLLDVPDPQKGKLLAYTEEPSITQITFTSQQQSVSDSVDSNVNAMENLKITNKGKSQKTPNSSEEKDSISSVSHCVASTTTDREKLMQTKCSQDMHQENEENKKVPGHLDKLSTDLSERQNDESRSDKQTKKENKFCKKTEIQSKDKDKILSSFDAAKVAKVWQDTVARDKSKPPLKLKFRHVNQVFIRGDNVVSVSLVYK